MPQHSAGLRALYAIVAAFVLTGCHPYNQTYYTRDTQAKYLNAGLRSPIVEFDDDGYLRDPSQLDAVLGAMDTAAASSREHPPHPVVVLVFIHGWHNNASLENDNLRKFNEFANALETRLQSQPATAKTTVLPIYFAWRGQNTWNPHWYNTYVIPFAAQYLTFFSRKATAERIGRGQLEIALARISRKWHEWRLSPSSVKRQNYLVIAGHSFGGAALLTATLPQLVAEQEAARARAAARLDATAETEAAASLVQSSLAPANLLIAVNPAIEASMLDRTVLSDGAMYAHDGETPQLLVLDADNDGARNFWFKIGQSVGNLTHVRTPHSSAERLAVAKLPGQVKFSLSRDGAVPPGGHACDSVPLTKDTLHLVTLDERPCTNSVMVVQTHQKIIDGHNGIWGPENREFLIQFVGKQHAGFVKSIR
jgi:hypothetical protein